MRNANPERDSEKMGTILLPCKPENPPCAAEIPRYATDPDSRFCWVRIDVSLCDEGFGVEFENRCESSLTLAQPLTTGSSPNCCVADRSLCSRLENNLGIDCFNGRDSVPSPSEKQAFPGVPEWLVSYRKDWLQLDIIAGITAAAVVIPKSMAYATIAGLPVEVGLYTAFLPMVIYAFLGTSRVLSVTTSSTIAILTAAELGEVAANGGAHSLLTATVTLTFLVGAILVLSCALRLGFVANFISHRSSSVLKPALVW